MTDRTTRCPACGTRFRVTDTQLEAAGGRVRCGSCLEVFVAGVDAAGQDAAQHDEIPRDAPPGAPAADPPARGAAPASRHRAVLEVFGDGPLPVPELGLDETDLRAGARRSPVPAFLLALLLAAALVGQYAWWRRDALAAIPALYPVYQRACTLLGCRAPLRRDPSLIRSLRVVVREVDEPRDRLLLDALIVNEGPDPQPFPILELVMTTPDARPLAARRFRPDEYLSGELAGARVMPPRTPVRISLALVRPGDFGSYRVAFR